MIYIKSFKNYEEFKSIFGVVEHGNGVKSRKNKILLAWLKDRRFLKWWLEFRSVCISHNHCEEEMDMDSYLFAKDMASAKRCLEFLLSSGVNWNNLYSRMDEVLYKIPFEDIRWTMWHPHFSLDTRRGLCDDGDFKSVRYVNNERERVFKMKAGKFITSCIDNVTSTKILPEQVKRWAGEEFARDWQSYAEQAVDTNKYELHVNHNFADIYDSRCCLGDFKSCMTNKDNYSFYEYSIDCKAAYLTNEDGDIVARCIVYQDVRDDSCNHYRLAERQYSTDGDDVLKQILVDKLIKAGEIDGYKRVGADCHDNMNFVTNDGESMKHLVLSIDCRLDFGDRVSYQDSFVYYDKDCGRAYNCGDVDYDYELDTTEDIFGTDDACWSEVNACYIANDEAVYDDYNEDYIYTKQSTDAIFRGERININRDYVENNSSWLWSDHEDMYIYYDECIYVDIYDDYFS